MLLPAVTPAFLSACAGGSFVDNHFVKGGIAYRFKVVVDQAWADGRWDVTTTPSGSVAFNQATFNTVAAGSANIDGTFTSGGVAYALGLSATGQPTAVLEPPGGPPDPG